MSTDTEAALALAQECGFVVTDYDEFSARHNAVWRFYQRARAMERERIASHFDAEPAHSAGAWIARAIRAMGEKP